MTGVVVTDTLPDGVSFVAAMPGDYVSTDPLVWNVDTLDPGFSWTAIITAQVDGTADPIGGNVASVRSDQQGETTTDPVLPPGGGNVEEPGECDADAYEDDDLSDQAKPIQVGAAHIQAHNFCHDYTDWITLTAQAGGVYTITTSSWGQRADTFLALFDTDGSSQLAANDDYSGTTDYSSRITWQAPSNGVYFVRIDNQARLTGLDTGYDIWIKVQEMSYIYLPIVTRGHRPSAVTGMDTVDVAPVDTFGALLYPTGIISHTCPDDYDRPLPDDTWQQAKPIEIGVLQAHSFDSDPGQYAADKDYVWFDVPIFTVSRGKFITFTIPLVTNTQPILELHDQYGAALAVTGTTQLTWKPAATGRYYLSVRPEDGSTAFGCTNDTGYHLLLEIEEAHVIFLPLAMKNS
jgi:hypothetical protein